MSEESLNNYIRPHAVASNSGFYPSDPINLRLVVNRYMRNAENIGHGVPIGLIAPHAGYIYSGSVAGHAYGQVRDQSYDTVIVIAPSHFEGFSFISVMPSGGYRTPLGVIRVDEDLAAEIAGGSSDNIRLSLKGHYVRDWEQPEHSLEVHLPFLQIALGEFKFVPILMDLWDFSSCEKLGRAISDACKSKKVLIVASSDLSHFHPIEVAKKIDKEFIETLEKGEAKLIFKGTRSRKFEACGSAPITALLCATSELGCEKPVILNYSNSGEAPNGDKERVVGYLAAAIYPKKKSEEPLPEPNND